MSGLTGRVEAIVLSKGMGEKEWHQRTAVVKRAKGLYDLFPAYPDAGVPTRIQFVPRPYQSNNATEGVTPEALLFTVVDQLGEQPNDPITEQAIEHINQALHLLHLLNPITDKD